MWYLGEETYEYEDGEVVCACGAWTSGEDGALPGVQMLDDPQVGDVYRQEHYAGVAEDYAEVVAVGETFEVEAGTFTDCIKTRDLSAIDTSIDGYKWHCPDVGNVLLEEGGVRVELVRYGGL